MISPQEAIATIKKGGVVALPTETVYGLAGSVENESALARIFEIKGRPLFDPLIVHVLGAEDAKRMCSDFGDLHLALAEEFWPGPLTLVGPRTPLVSDLITAGQETVALRSPAHPVFRQVLAGVGSPLAAPSANRFKKTSPTRAEHVAKEFDGQVPVVEGGECEVGIESTIVQPSWQGKGQIQIVLYRPGVIQAEDIKNFLQRRFDASVVLTRVGSGGVQPGQLEDHYQPSLPLLLILDGSMDPAVEAKKLGYTSPVVIKLPDEVTLAARRLYSSLRESSEVASADSLVLVRPTWWDEGRAEALRDRLLKASAKVLPV